MMTIDFEGGKPVFTIHVEPNEIHEAIDAYKEWLSPEQIKMIKKRNEKFIIVRQAPLSTLVLWGTDGKNNPHT